VGSGSTTLKWIADVHGFTVTPPGSIVRDLTIRGMGATATGFAFGVNSGSATNITVERCIIEEWRGGGINTGGSGSFWLITRNIVRNNYQDGIYIADGMSNNTVSNNLVQDNGANGIDINGSGNLVVDNTITGNGRDHPKFTADNWGILIQAVSAQRVHADRNIVSRNVVYANRNGAGIAIRGEGAFHANYTIVEGNQSHENVDGIHVDGSASGEVEGTLVMGNVANNNTRYGIVVSSNNSTPRRTRISNNIATGDSVGIYLGSPSETTVTDNTLVGNVVAFIDRGSTNTVRNGNRLTSGSLTGRVSLSAGRGTVKTAEVQENDNILLTSVGGGGSSGSLRITNIKPGVGFAIESSSGTDMGVIFWEIVH